jgi:hypothetical protein
LEDENGKRNDKHQPDFGGHSAAKLAGTSAAYAEDD